MFESLMQSLMECTVGREGCEDTNTQHSQAYGLAYRSLCFSLLKNCLFCAYSVTQCSDRDVCSKSKP